MVFIFTLESHDQVSEGKYTIGLGQEKMAVCSAAEDAISICLSAFSRLLKRFNLEAKDIGRIEVGSESNPDRAKAIKSHLVSLLGKLPIAGSDNIQACYGGTAALLNASAWLESSQWEIGKYAVVVAGDVAIYEGGGARATGGAGAVAILLARGLENATIKIEKRFGHYASHVYDFYKPDPFSEYPKVDGPLSVTAYLQSALNAYTDWLRKESPKADDSKISDLFDKLIFHSPYSKIVYKAFCQLQLLEPNCPLKVKDLSKLTEEQRAQVDSLFKQKASNNLEFSRNLGNSYCASVFFNLLCSLTSLNETSSSNCRIGIFSYGSGSMATFFSIRISNKPCAWLNDIASELRAKLSNRIKISPQQYETLMKRRKEMYGISNWLPLEEDLDDLLDGTFYLSQIDSERRRIYLKKEQINDGK